MVTKWGMSDKLGPLQYEETQEGYLGMGGAQRTMMSSETNKLIDTEIRGLVDGAHDKATKLLTKNRAQLELLAQALLEYETLTGEEIEKLLEDGKIDRPEQPSGPAIARPTSGSAVPKAGKRFGSSGGPARQGA
jgi:cell division protease FtsH